MNDISIKMPPESWASKFRDSALKRIGEYEKFLATCGIIAFSGSELEFHFNPTNSDYVKLDAISEFRNSSVVEGLLRVDPKIGEIVLGAGPRSHVAKYPRERTPSTIVRATNSVQKILSTGCSRYGMDIHFGEQNGKRVRSLQCNISLWNNTNKNPLFLGNSPMWGESQYRANELTLECTKSFINAQHALSALVCTDKESFERLSVKKNAAFGISIDTKFPDQTLALRISKCGNPFIDSSTNTASKENRIKKTAFPPSLYFEDRLASSKAEPALAMLIALGGIVEGVKAYMVKKGLVDSNNVPDPAKLKSYLDSPAFSEMVTMPQAKGCKMGHIEAPWNYNYKLPNNGREALQQLESNPLARRIMGEEFHRHFCAEYQQCMVTPELCSAGASRL